MANADRPQGFRPYGEPRQVIEMVAGAACYPGDFVQLQSDGKVDPVAAGATIFGCALSYASADGQKVLVSVHPEQIYVGQADETEIDDQTDVGNNCDIVATAGDSTYKTSRQEIDSSTIAASSAQLTILGLEKSVGNALGAQAKILVRINEHQVAGKDAFAGV